MPGDITRYNELATAEEAAEVGKNGWNMKNGFQRPKMAGCLGDGLEAGPRWCVPKTALREAVGGLGGIWRRWPKTPWDLRGIHLNVHGMYMMYMAHFGIGIGLDFVWRWLKGLFCWFWYDRRDVWECKVQILGMSVVTLIFALLGFLSPAHRQCLMWDVWCLHFLFFFVPDLLISTGVYWSTVGRGQGWTAAVHDDAVYLHGGSDLNFSDQHNSHNSPTVRSTRGLRRLRFCSVA